MPTNYFSREYWLDVVQTKIPILEAGLTRCLDWSHQALQLQGVRNNFSIKQADLGPLVVDLYWQPRKTHVWLEANYNNNVYIADGHAGQFDCSFPSGYFGFLKDAPDKLKDVYLKGKSLS